MASNILIQYFQWHFSEMPKKILHIWKNYLRFYSYFFSIPLLLKTFFAPWRRYGWSYGRGFSIRRYAEVFISNIFSRCVGAVMRSFLIIFGFGAEIFVLIAGACLFLIWILSPAIIIISFCAGIKYLF